MKAHDDVFLLPIKNSYLLYAPLRNLQALIDPLAARAICQGLAGNPNIIHPVVHTLLRNLLEAAFQQPTNNSGLFPSPLFLGIIPTRGCNMGCSYCDFAAAKKHSPVMSLELARASVDAYFLLLHELRKSHLEIQFFGGEPFFASEVVDFVVGFATDQAHKQGFTVRFEVTTNGLYSERRAHWIAAHFDSVVLSLDGPEDIQNAHRPAPNGQTTFDVVKRSATVFSEGDCELIIRACITQSTTPRLPEIARWIGESFRPSTVCLESLTQSPHSVSSGLSPPDPWDFAFYFDQARTILASKGIRTVLSTAETHHNRASCCPVGNDALIVSPDGSVDACYLPPESWQAAGMDMHLGHLKPDSEHFVFEPQSLNHVRQHSVYQRSLCDACFCRYHCAGGCHVQHNTSGPPGSYDDLCILTRLVTAATLLRSLGQDELAAAWFHDVHALNRTAYQASDRMLNSEVNL